jgi:hypothetical protein
LKHAALVELASLLARSSSVARSGVSFVDTHTFQLHAPVADRARWEKAADSLFAKHPAYDAYVIREREFITRTGEYRCSAGLCIDALGDRRACAVLAESNAASRAVIVSQIASEKLANVTLVDDAAEIDRAATVPANGALLVHVDPFSLSLETWATFAPALDAITARSAATALIAYRYSRNARTPWPAAPASTIGPIAEIRGGPHEVAAYASPALAEAVIAICASLGWHPSHCA